MCRTTLYFSLLAVLSACSPAPPRASQTTLYLFRLDPPALIELSSDYHPVREIPLSIPAGCGLDNLFPAPRGASIAMELSCSFGQAVVWLNTDTGEFKQTVSDSDSHFLAWTPDGSAMYLKVASINNPHIIRASLGGKQDNVPITELTYDLAPTRDGFLFSFSRGMGFGSEMDFAQLDDHIVKQVAVDSDNYLSFARWSPDGKQIAFIKIPDSTTPFTVGELWLVQADGSQARKLADADAGHGFASAWSPDGTRIAFVARGNPEDAQANQSADALVSNIYLVDVESGKPQPLTKFQNARVEAPFWSPDGNSIGFTVILDGRMQVQVVDISSGETRPVITEPACCPAWMRK